MRLVLLTESLCASADDVGRFANQCDTRITPDELEHIRPMLKQSIDFYTEISAVEPWIGYVSVSMEATEKPDNVVGCCGFKGNPNEQNEVEIAYHTFARCESQGYATAMAGELFGIAKKFGDSVGCVVAHTLPEENASTSVLKKNDFTFAGEVVDTEDGNLWRWTKHVER